MALGENNNSEALKRRPPHRLQKLENMPKLTAEMLRQKIDAAEENRKKVECVVINFCSREFYNFTS